MFQILRYLYLHSWNSIINSSTEELYANFVLYFRSVCAIYPDLLKYVEDIILDQVKEKIVCAWTNQVQHFDNTTTNIVESAHTRLNNWLGYSKGKFWDVADQMLQK